MNRGQTFYRFNFHNDLVGDQLQELDRAAAQLNVSRQAVIKIFVRQALDQQQFGPAREKDKLSP